MCLATKNRHVIFNSQAQSPKMATYRNLEIHCNSYTITSIYIYIKYTCHHIHIHIQYHLSIPFNNNMQSQSINTFHPFNKNNHVSLIQVYHYIQQHYVLFHEVIERESEYKSYLAKKQFFMVTEDH